MLDLYYDPTIYQHCFWTLSQILMIFKRFKHSNQLNVNDASNVSRCTSCVWPPISSSLNDRQRCREASHSEQNRQRLTDCNWNPFERTLTVIIFVGTHSVPKYMSLQYKAYYAFGGNNTNVMPIHSPVRHVSLNAMLMRCPRPVVMPNTFAKQGSVPRINKNQICIRFGTNLSGLDPFANHCSKRDVKFLKHFHLNPDQCCLWDVWEALNHPYLWSASLHRMKNIHSILGCEINMVKVMLGNHILK